MTREHKLALVVGFGLILFVGILVTDHLAADARGHDALPSARIDESPAITLLARDDARTPLVEEPAPTAGEVRQVPEIVFDTGRTDRSGLARPMSPIETGPRVGIEDGPLAGRGMATPPPPRDRTHVVARGETLSEIAAAAYGDPAQWRRIANSNPGINPNRLRPGTVLRLPVADSTPRRVASAREVPETRTPATSTRAYTVRSGDSLAKIARRELGKESRWREIAHLNGIADESVFPGQVLNLPVS